LKLLKINTNTDANTVTIRFIVWNMHYKKIFRWSILISSWDKVLEYNKSWKFLKEFLS
jgi:hypothetical protein